MIRTLSDCARASSPFGYFADLPGVRDDTKRAIISDFARSAAPPPPTGNQHRYTKGETRNKGGKPINGKVARNTKGGGHPLIARARAIIRQRRPAPTSPTSADGK